MIKAQLFGLYILLQSLLPAGKFKGNEHPRMCIRKAGTLPAKICESSGLEILNEDTLITHNDGGDKARIFTISETGELIETVDIGNASNTDWEDLTRDSAGNLYIGDFGNNNNTRKDLSIYRYSLTEKKVTGRIQFSYPDQQEFPPSKKQKNFDCEAMFWHEGYIYLFSKNRGKKLVKVYRLPDKPGEYTAELRDSLKIRSMITGADIASDEKSFVLLTYGKLYFFKVNGERIDFSQPWFSRSFSRSGQAEAVVYLSPNKLVVTNEGGKVFHVREK